MLVRKSNPLFYAVIGAFVVLIIEFTAYLAIHFVLLPREPAFFFHSPTVNATEFERYMAIRDPLLGWPARKHDNRGAEVVESRPIPAYPKAGNECVSLYGDSFTYGDEVEHSQAWSNVLSSQLRCRVGNYGVGGYGTDQAYLRFLKNARDSAKIVILGIFPENVLRNVNRYRYFLDARTVFSLKPRFVLEQDRLRLVELPVWSQEQFLAATQNPNQYFDHEIFLPDTEYGPVSLSFPYSWRAMQFLLSARARSAMLGHTSWEVFYRDDHPAQALRITADIAELFDRTSRSRGQTPIVVIYPTARSFKQFKDTGVVITRPLLERLQRKSIPYLDLHEGFGRRVAKEHFCELLTNPANCTGHFNAAGNAMVSDIVYESLIDMKLVAARPLTTASTLGGR